jgi:hypothetical protein
LSVNRRRVTPNEILLSVVATTEMDNPHAP